MKSVTSHHYDHWQEREERDAEDTYDRGEAAVLLVGSLIFLHCGTARDTSVHHCTIVIASYDGRLVGVHLAVAAATPTITVHATAAIFPEALVLSQVAAVCKVALQCRVVRSRHHTWVHHAGLLIGHRSWLHLLDLPHARLRLDQVRLGSIHGLLADCVSSCHRRLAHQWLLLETFLVVSHLN